MYNLLAKIFQCTFLVTTLVHLSLCIADSWGCNNKPKSTICRITDITKVFLMPLLFLTLFFYTLSDYGIQESGLQFPTRKLIIILCALICGTLGDFFLLKEQDQLHFKFGLLFFLIGHFFYLLLLIPVSGILSHPWWFYIIALVVYPIAVFLEYNTAQKPKSMTGLAIIIYSAVLSFVHFICLSMLIFSLKNHDPIISKSIFAVIGSTLFVISDSLLAVRIFAKKFVLSRFIIMLTYIAAQVFIVLALI